MEPQYTVMQIRDIPRYVAARNQMAIETPYVISTTYSSELEFFHQHLTNQDSLTLLASDTNQAIMGAATLSIHPTSKRDLRIWRVGVLRSASGNGICTRLMKVLLDKAYQKKQYYDHVSLTVDVKNPDAKRLYEKLGFIAVSIFNNENNSKSVLMHYPLV